MNRLEKIMLFLRHPIIFYRGWREKRWHIKHAKELGFRNMSEYFGYLYVRYHKRLPDK